MIGRAVNHPRFLRALLDARGVWRWMCRLSMVQYSSDLNDRHAHLTNRHLNATHKDFQGYWQAAQGWGWQASGGRRAGLRTRGVDCWCRCGLLRGFWASVVSVPLSRRLHAIDSADLKCTTHPTLHTVFKMP